MPPRMPKKKKAAKAAAAGMAVSLDVEISTDSRIARPTDPLRRLCLERLSPPPRLHWPRHRHQSLRSSHPRLQRQGQHVPHPPSRAKLALRPLPLPLRRL
jgi:hypothetical protein